MEWWRDTANVVELARWLEERCELATADVIYLFEKPWKWTPEFNAMRAQERAEAAMCEHLRKGKLVTDNVVVGWWCKDCEHVHTFARAIA